MNEREAAKFRRENIGFVFQTVALVPVMTARENVEFALRMAGKTQKMEERALECLKMVGLAGRASHMPAEMSGGAQQRTAIARAVAHKPSVILADEPTGAVDVKTGAYILDVFREINRTMGTTIVIVTHDRALSASVDRVANIRNGKISSEKVLK